MENCKTKTDPPSGISDHLLLVNTFWDHTLEKYTKSKISHKPLQGNLRFSKMSNI